MKINLSLKYAAILVFVFSLCGKITAQEEVLSIIPIPTQYEVKEGNFKFDEKTIFYVDTTNTEVYKVAEGLQTKLRMVSGMLIPIQPLSNFNEHTLHAVAFQLDSLSDLGKEGYKLEVNTRQITLNAKQPAGLFYGVQSLIQLLPPEIVKKEIIRAFDWTVPAVSIRDVPKYKWRGLHLDTGRHVSSIAFIKEYLDNMAMHKLNTFHWHLTEDQGWRLEIKKYPLLTEVGAFRDSTLVGHYGTGKYDGKRYGGFYTQEEAKEIVAYAKNLYITVVPEIEMPGHSTAA
ncbi:MAG: beta-N-acetylhexosaminidase, partial [Leeuwenhoekiella sp.]|nr:beta-N-acetylhexosaminidase [Leeuwenhoekiella sp.]